MNATDSSMRPEMSINESLDYHVRVISEINAPDSWNELNQSEKALCVNYRRLLTNGLFISPLMILKINAIHEKHPGFHMGALPDGGPA